MDVNKPSGKSEFESLSFFDQGKTLNTQILSIEKALALHIKLAKSEGKSLYDLKEKYIVLLERVLKTLS
jgi:hypothetical protein